MKAVTQTTDTMALGPSFGWFAALFCLAENVLNNICFLSMQLCIANWTQVFLCFLFVFLLFCSECHVSTHCNGVRSVAVEVQQVPAVAHSAPVNTTVEGVVYLDDVPSRALQDHTAPLANGFTIHYGMITWTDVQKNMYIMLPIVLLYPHPNRKSMEECLIAVIILNSKSHSCMSACVETVMYIDIVIKNCHVGTVNSGLLVKHK